MSKKKNIIPKDTRYVPLTQQSYCCVPTCMQIVMLRHNIPLVSVELMAHYMEVVVPKKEGKLFWNVRTTSKRSKAGYGTRLNEDLTADPMFKKLSIPLRMQWNLIDNFNSVDEIKKYMQESVKANKDVLLCYQYGALFNTNHKGGHVCVLDRIYPKKGEVRFIDPECDVPKWRTVKISKLFKAMRAHGQDKMGGFWEIKKI